MVQNRSYIPEKDYYKEKRNFTIKKEFYIPNFHDSLAVMYGKDFKSTFWILKKKSKLNTSTSFLSDTVKEKVVIKMLIAFELPTIPWANSNLDKKSNMENELLVSHECSMF